MSANKLRIGRLSAWLFGFAFLLVAGQPLADRDKFMREGDSHGQQMHHSGSDRFTQKQHREDRRPTDQARKERPPVDRHRSDKSRYSVDQRRRPSQPAYSRGDREGYGVNRRDKGRVDGDRQRADRKRWDWEGKDYRYPGYRRPPPPPTRHPWAYGPKYPYYGKPWYGYPKRYYPRYRYYYRDDVDDDFWGWLAFTAITLAIIDNLNEQQQREHELAMREALEAPVGETIRWNDTRAAGSVTVIRDGTSSEGRYCREYQHKVVVGGQSQQAYGTACRNADGSWEIMN